jgi:hypothetical protein
MQITTGGTVYKLVRVAVGSTILHKHALARPNSAMARCESFVVATLDVVPLSMTEAMISSATDAMLAVWACIGARVVVVICEVGARVVVAICMVVTVVTTR